MNASPESKASVLAKSKDEFLKLLKHLRYSYEKTKSLSLSEEILEDEEILETFEGLASRFARSSDIFISRYLRGFVMMQEPGFRGSLLDLFNQAAKLNVIENVDLWVEIREFRNSAVHEYRMSDLVKVFQRFVELTPHLLDVPKKMP